MNLEVQGAQLRLDSDDVKVCTFDSGDVQLSLFLAARQLKPSGFPVDGLSAELNKQRMAK